jgi:D-alanine-D-alanine ligase
VTNLTTLVVMGGPDAEREISIASGSAIADALAASGRTGVEAITIDQPSQQDVCSWDTDVIFPALHGPWGEGGGMQRLLETAGHAYVGSAAPTALACMNKVTTKERCAAAGVPTPGWELVGRSDPVSLPCPVVVKAVSEGSSIDLVICHDRGELDAARNDLHTRHEHLMVETYIAGREITVGLLDGDPLPLIEIVPATPFYDYHAKYERDDTQYIIDPDLGKTWSDLCTTLAVTCWEAMGCRHVARIDFMVDNAGPHLLEINTMPGFTTHSLVPKAAAAAGVEMPTLCSNLVIAAHRDGSL